MNQFRCPVCNQILGVLNLSHIKKHGYTSVSDFIKDYPQTAPYRDFEKRATGPKEPWNAKYQY